MKLNQREQMLWQEQVAGYAVDEANLYLDTHCNDPEALANMTKYQLLLKKATEEYEAAYGPLTADSPDATGRWRWVNCPWPWELEG